MNAVYQENLNSRDLVVAGYIYYNLRINNFEHFTKNNTTPINNYGYCNTKYNFFKQEISNFLNNHNKKSAESLLFWANKCANILDKIFNKDICHLCITLDEDSVILFNMFNLSNTKTTTIEIDSKVFFMVETPINPTYNDIKITEFNLSDIVLKHEIENAYFRLIQ